MQLSISSKAIHPPATTPETRLEGGKHLTWGNLLCIKTLPSGQNRESEALPQGHKVKKFHKCIYKL